MVRTTGTLWMDWIDSNGAQGEEPPDWAKQLIELSSQWSLEPPNSDRWMELGNQLTQIYIENMPDIGTVGGVPAPVIVHNRLGNIAEWTVQVYDYYFHYPFRIDQVYIKE